MKDFEVLTNCCLCSSTKLHRVISLEPTPPANEFIEKAIQQDKFPLDLMQCQRCGHHQMSGEVNPKRVFTDYCYASGTSVKNQQHFKDFADEMVELCNLNNKSFVFEIGSNDGTMLKAFQQYGIQVLGIDPAKKIAEMANVNGVPTINDFFKSSKGYDIAAQYGKADVIIANNVMAHTSDLIGIMSGIQALMKDNGTFVMEASYFLDVLDNTLFDLLYAEHLHQHLISTLSTFFKHFDMTLYDVKRLPNHGGSVRVYVKNNIVNPLTRDSVYECINLEHNVNDKIKLFNKKVDDLGNHIRSRLLSLKDQGKTIAIFGYPAKLTTMLHQFKLNADVFDFAVDSSELKQGLFSPGLHIPVLNPDELYRRKPDYVFVGAWNFSESIMNNHSKRTWTWIIPLPEFKEL